MSALPLRAAFVYTRPYITAHPESALGDPNEAHKHGWRFVAFLPNDGAGLILYRRRNWLETLLGI
jgi:hypothetical protein